MLLVCTHIRIYVAFHVYSTYVCLKQTSSKYVTFFRIEPIEGGMWGQVGSRRLVKAPIRTQTAVLCLEYVTYCKLIWEAQTAVRSSLVPHAVLLMLPGQ